MKNKQVSILLIFCLILFSNIAMAKSQTLPVKVIQPAVKTVEINKVLNGIIEPYQNVLLSAKLGGVIEKINVQIGDVVKQDQILVLFDQEQIQIQLKQAEAALELAKANLEIIIKGASKEDKQLAQTSYEQANITYAAAEKNLEFAQSLFADRTMQKQQLLAAKTQLEAAQVQLQLADERNKQAVLALDLAKDDYDRMSYLYSNGVITQQQYDGVVAQYKNAQSALTSAQLAEEQAQVSYEGAKEGYQLAEDTFDNRLTAQQQVDAAVTQVEMAATSIEIALTNLEKLNKGATAEQIRISKANLKQAEASLELANLQLKNSVIKSPITGVVAQISLDAGEMAGPGVPVITIIDLNQVYLQVDVTADVITSLTVDQSVGVKVLVFSDEKRQGKISLISPMVDPRSQAYPVKILLDNSDHRLKPGMFAEAMITLEKSENTVAVPVETVFNLENAPYLFVVNFSADGKSGVAEKRLIEVGLSNDEEIEVTKGLRSQEKVVIMGQFTLTNGDLVEVSL